MPDDARYRELVRNESEMLDRMLSLILSILRDVREIAPDRYAQLLATVMSEEPDDALWH